jgi:hypothetical protein
VNWGAPAYDAAHGAVVGISSRASGTLLGSGFWISARAVATAWAAVKSQTEGVHVTVYQAAGPPIVLDAVLVYAVPALGIAYLTVNPLTVGGMLVTPTVLTVASSFATGQSVYSLAASASGLQMASGVVQTASTTFAGYVSDVRATLSFLGTAEGAPIVRVPDAAIVGMVQYGDAQVFFDVTVRGTTVGGISGRSIAAATYWATQESTAIGAPFVLGATTLPIIRSGVSLGQRVAVESEAAATAILPMPTAGIAPTAVELGVPCTGALVGVPVLPTANPVQVFNPVRAGLTLTFDGQQTVTPAATAAGSSLALSTGYIRAPLPGVFTDISNTGTAMSTPTSTSRIDNTQGVADVTALVTSTGTNSVRLSVVPGPGDPTASTAVVATRIFVSALGMVGFDILGTFASFGAMDVAKIVQDPVTSSQVQYPPLYVAPFASLDFLSSTSTYSSASAPLPGTMGGPLAVFIQVFAGSFIVQWQGYAASTLAPVCFQVQIGLDAVGSELTSLTSGEITFAYRSDVMTGAWAGQPWLTSTTVSVQASDPPLDQKPRLIQTITPPVGGEAIYWGVGSASGSNMCSVVASDGTTYMLGPHGENTADPLPTPSVAATVVVANTTAVAPPYFAYSVFLGDAPTDVRTVTAINGAGVGNVDVNDATLTDVILQTALSATASIPSSVALQFRTTGFGTSSTLLPAPLSLFLNSARTLGQAPASGTGTVTAASYRFVPALTLAPGFYSGVAMTVPYAYLATTGAGEPQQPQILSVTGSIAFTIADLATYLGGEGISGTFILSLVNTDSSLLYDEWPDTSGSPSLLQGTTITVSFDYVPESPVTVTTRLSYGYASSVSSTTTSTFATDFSVPFTLSYDPAMYVPRINGMTVGRPCVSSFAPQYDIGGFPNVLVPGTVTVTNVTTALRTVSSAPDPTTMYYVTATPRLVDRPSPVSSTVASH